MSEKKEINALMLALDESSALDKKFQELKLKKLELDERRVSLELDKIHQNDKDLELTKNSNFGQMSEAQIENIIKLNDDYIEAAKNRAIFIDHVFDSCIPMFRKNIILVCGSTGGGKSTVVNNIVRSTIAQKNKNGEYKKVLVITNEQGAEDFYNCITCLIKGWEYNNHNLFTQEQKDTFSKYIKFLAGSGLVTVIDDNYNGSRGVTKSVEGLKTILDNLIDNKQFYDCIVIDYIQNFKDSKLDPKLNEWQVQAKVASLLDTYKNIYPAPFIVMAQIQPNKEDEDIPFQFRMKGAKVIGDVSTLIVEIVPEYEKLRTGWTVHKSRFTKGVGETFYTGYDKGSYVPYDDEFRKKAQVYQEKRQQAMMNEIAGLAMNKKVKDEDSKN